MPYIIGKVTKKSGTTSSPCLDFQAQCVNKPYINPVITHAPPYFYITVPKDEYVLEVTSGSGGVATKVAKVLSDFGGVQLKFSVT